LQHLDKKKTSQGWFSTSEFYGHAIFTGALTAHTKWLPGT